MAGFSETKFQNYIRRRLSYWIILLAIVIISGSFYNVWQIFETVQTHLIEKRVVEAENIQDSVSNWLVDNMNMITTYDNLILHLDYDEISYTKKENKYFILGQNKTDIDALYIGFSDGSFITGADWIPPKTYDPRKRVWYMDALSKGRTVIGDTYLDQDTLKTIFTISTPATSQDGFNGVIGMDFYLNTVNSRLKSIVSGTDFEVALIDGNGVIVHYTADPFLSGKSVNEIQNSKLGRFYNQYLTSDGEGSRFIEVKNEQILLMDRIEYSKWMVCIFSTKGGLSNIADVGIRQHYLINGLLVVLALMALYAFYTMDQRLKQNQLEMQKHIEELDTAQKTIELINKQLVLKSNTDGLTRVFNRGYLDEQLERYWTAGLVDKKVLGLILVDVDHFKRYNDTYGHIAGDQILIRICREMSRVLDPKFILARYGGEEFAILAYDTDEDQMMTLANKVRERVDQAHIDHETSEYKHITISVGVNVFLPKDHETIGNFIHKADLALYEAKMSGRNKVILYSGRR